MQTVKQLMENIAELQEQALELDKKAQMIRTHIQQREVQLEKLAKSKLEKHSNFPKGLYFTFGYDYFVDGHHYIKIESCCREDDDDCLEYFWLKNVHYVFLPETIIPNIEKHLYAFLEFTNLTMFIGDMPNGFINNNLKDDFVWTPMAIFEFVSETFNEKYYIASNVLEKFKE